MSNKAKVTVILLSYNHAKYLHESIDSALNQTFSDFELIIWDDASSDESWDIIQSYHDPRIHAVRNEINKMGIINTILSSNTNLGDYIAIHHSDDVWEPEKLEKQVACLDKNPQIGAVFSNALIIGENSKPLEDKSHPYYSVFDQPNRNRFEWLNFFFYHGNVLCHPSVLIRQECFRECGLYRNGLIQLPDFDMWIRLCLKYEIHIIQDKLTLFRVRSGELNASGDRADARIRQQFEYLQIYDSYLYLQSREEIIKVFPDAQKYIKPEGYDIGFVLAMVFLEAHKFNTTNLFALNLLFQALNDPERASRIKDLYNFDLKKFIELSGKYDVFSIEKTSYLPWVSGLIKRLRTSNLWKTIKKVEPAHFSPDQEKE